MSTKRPLLLKFLCGIPLSEQMSPSLWKMTANLPFSVQLNSVNDIDLFPHVEVPQM